MTDTTTDQVKPGRLLVYIEHFRLSGEGAENDAMRTCRKLAARGWDVHVAARDATDVPGISTYPGAFGELAAVTEKVQPDVTLDWGFNFPADLHRFVTAPHEPFLPYASLSRGNLGAWWHDIFHYRKDRRCIGFERELLANPHAVFLPNSTFVKELTIAAGAAPEAVQVLYVGVDLERFSPAHCADLRADMRADLGLDPTETAFLFVGHNLKLKNFALANRTIAALRRAGHQARLMLAGKRRPMRWPDYAIYIETTPQVEAVYAAADVLIHPTWFDCFSNVVIEAMACGLPVLNSEYNGVVDIIDSGRNGLTLPVNGPRQAIDRQWFEAAAELIRNPEHAEAISKAARQTAMEYPVDRYIDEFEGIIKDALRRRRSRVEA